MRVGIVTNWNGKGLQLDGELLEAFLSERGHEVGRIQFDQPHDEKYDLLVFLEVINENFFQLSPIKVWVPNLEWAKSVYLRHGKKFDRIWAKTRDAERVLRTRFSNVEYTGWLGRDRKDAFTPLALNFLHVGGDSGLKGTNAVLSAWREWRYWGTDEPGELTVVSRAISTIHEDTPGVRFYTEVTDAEISHLQNTRMFHLQPSGYEGYGHALREAQSVGGILLTTAGGPMHELGAPFEVHPVGSRKMNLAMVHEVSGREIREKVNEMMRLPNYEIARLQLEARSRWKREQEESVGRLERALDNLGRRYSSPKVSIDPGAKNNVIVGILGNFRPEHSTENDLKWSLEDMGHQVVQFQEDRTSVDEIERECGEKGVSLLIYVHTHGWKVEGDLDKLWVKLEGIGCRTCSFHLDRYWGLNQLDRREDLVGKHPFWHTDIVFTADGGNQEKFAERRVNHVWLPPAICKRNCYFGEWKGELASDIGFVGATSYHPEYQFREELIESLRREYGDKFRVYQGIRGAELNNVYASGRVFVGDSCFGGADFYFSDRCPETVGRGGFLLHHATRGLNIPGLATYSPQDLSDLHEKIAWWLGRPEEREKMQQVAMEWVASNETYNQRMECVLKVMGLR